MDALLVLMVVIWGVNYSVLKRAFLEIPPPVFATLRLAIASAVYLAAIWVARRSVPGGASTGLAAIFRTPHAVTARDRRDLIWLGLSGHCLYQLFFVGGLARTTASNGALIFGTTPAVVALASALMGHERVGLVHWAGAALSGLGIYFVVGHGASLESATLVGDLMIGAGVVCWAAYTIGGIRLMARHSPLFVTGVSMAIGTVPYALISLPDFAGVRWAALSGAVWGALLFASLGAFCFCYLVWYAGVQRLGPSHTAMYSNAIPLVAMLVAALWLGEPLTVLKAAGAALVVSGVVLTRLRR